MPEQVVHDGWQHVLPPRRASDALQDEHWVRRVWPSAQPLHEESQQVAVNDLRARPAGQVAHEVALLHEVQLVEQMT